MAEFVRDTALTPANPESPGRFTATLRPGWWIARGANGGYLAAIVARALHRSGGGSPLRSLTLHYTGTPEPGPVELDCQTLRRGRSLLTQRASMRQGERLIVTALAASGPERSGPRFSHRTAPDVPPPEACPPFEGARPVHQRWETRWVFGDPPGSSGARALAGGWIRTREPAPIDEAYVVAVCDAFSPPYFGTIARDAIAPLPTVELTVHLRCTLPRAKIRPGDYLLGRFESRSAAEGFVDEVGEVWSADGVLLAECRQLAAFLSS